LQLMNLTEVQQRNPNRTVPPPTTDATTQQTKSSTCPHRISGPTYSRVRTDEILCGHAATQSRLHPMNRGAGCGMDRPEQRAPRDGPATAAPCSGVTNLGASACCRRGRARPSSPTRPHERARDERGERRKGRDEQAAAAAGVRAHVSVYALRNDPETCGAERHG